VEGKVKFVNPDAKQSQETGLGIGLRFGATKNRIQFKGNRNQGSKHKMRTRMGMSVTREQ